MATPSAAELAGAWELEFAHALVTLPSVEDRFALVGEFVAHRLEAIASGHPACDRYVAGVRGLLARNLRGDAYARALAALPSAPSAPPGPELASVASRPAAFAFHYDLYWAAADLALEAGCDEAAPTQAEIDWQRARLRWYQAGRPA